MSRSSTASPVKIFTNESECLAAIVAARWPDGIVCPDCGERNAGSVAGRGVYQCRDCRRQFSARIGTIFEDSPLPLNAWFSAAWCVANGDTVSSPVLAEALSTTQATAWKLLHRVRIGLSLVERQGGEGGEAFDSLMGKLVQVGKRSAYCAAKAWKKKKDAKKKKK